MITLTREEAQQVLDALQAALSDDKPYIDRCKKTVETLRTRLAQPEPEPQEAIAKWIKTNTEHRQWYICPKCSHQTPRFKDEWQGLTDEEINELCVSSGFGRGSMRFNLIVQAIEAKLKEKNA